MSLWTSTRYESPNMKWSLCWHLEGTNTILGRHLSDESLVLNFSLALSKSIIYDRKLSHPKHPPQILQPCKGSWRFSRVIFFVCNRLWSEHGHRDCAAIMIDHESFRPTPRWILLFGGFPTSSTMSKSKSDLDLFTSALIKGLVFTKGLVESKGCILIQR